MTAISPKTEVLDCIHGEDCPLHAENPPFNAETLAAMQEARDIMSGKINVAWNHPSTKEALRETLKAQ